MKAILFNVLHLLSSQLDKNYLSYRKFLKKQILLFNKKAWIKYKINKTAKYKRTLKH